MDDLKPEDVLPFSTAAQRPVWAYLLSQWGNWSLGEPVTLVDNEGVEQTMSAEMFVLRFVLARQIKRRNRKK